MTITLNTLAYNQDAFVTPNKVRYTGPAHTFQIKDIIDLGRTAPKPSGTFPGMARTSSKFVETVTLADGQKVDNIIEVTSSFVVGTTDAQVDALRDRAGDWVISSDAGLLMKKHDITF